MRKNSNETHSCGRASRDVSRDLTSSQDGGDDRRLVRALTAGLPRFIEVFVHGRVKFRVGQIVYLAFSRDEMLMGFAFPKEEREAALETYPDKYLRPKPAELRYHWLVVRLDAIDEEELRSSSSTPGAWSCRQVLSLSDDGSSSDQLARASTLGYASARDVAGLRACRPTIAWRPRARIGCATCCWGSWPVLKGSSLRDGVRVHYQVFGNGPRAILLLPTWSVVHSDFWARQVPHLAARYTVITFDGRGNGASDRPTDPAAYSDWEFAADALAVLDTAGVEEAAVVSMSGGAPIGLILAAGSPERVVASVFIAPGLSLTPPYPERAAAIAVFDQPQPSYDGWLKFNRHYWQEDWEGFLEFFSAQCFSEPDSTRRFVAGSKWASRLPLMSSSRRWKPRDRTQRRSDA